MASIEVNRVVPDCYVIEGFSVIDNTGSYCDLDVNITAEFEIYFNQDGETITISTEMANLLLNRLKGIVILAEEIKKERFVNE